MVVEKGPDAQPIPSQKEASNSLIPERKSELPVEVFEKLRAFFLIKMNENLCVRVCIKLMTSGHKILPEIRIIEDFAVVNDPDGAIFIVDRLIPATEVDDAEPGMGQADPLLKIHAECFGAAMAHEP
jgi:hypothetical protein